jgi:hypothetical protein
VEPADSIRRGDQEVESLRNQRTTYPPLEQARTAATGASGSVANHPRIHAEKVEIVRGVDVGKARGGNRTEHGGGKSLALVGVDNVRRKPPELSSDQLVLTQ